MQTRSGGAISVREKESETPRHWCFRADILGARAGDNQSFKIAGPDGSVIVDSGSVLDESNASWFAFGGRRWLSEGWAPGASTRTFTLSRDGETLTSENVEVASRDSLRATAELLPAMP